MADLTITTAQVLPDTLGSIEDGIAGEAIDAGESIYKKSDDGKWYLTDADALATAATPAVAVNSAAAGQKVSAQKSGSPTIGAGAAPAVGQLYVASTTAGGIAPYADLASGDYVAIIGVGASGNKIKMRAWSSGIAKA